MTPVRGNMHLLVVCNSRHHSRSTLALAEQLIGVHGEGKVFAVCELADADYYAGFVDPQTTSIVPFTAEAGAAPTAGDTAKRSMPAGVFEKLYRGVAKLRSGTRSRSIRMLVDFARWSTLGGILQEKRALRHFRAQLALAGQLLEQVSPTAVLAFGDRHIDLEAAVLAAAKQRGVRIVLPYSTYSGSGGLLMIRKLQGEFSIWKPFSFYRLYARMLLGEQILDGHFWQPPSTLMALRKLGLLSNNPWCMGNGAADIVCVDNEATRKRYIDEGVPPEKIRIVGDTAYDALFERYRSRDRMLVQMIHEGFVREDRKIIIVALPQLAEQGVMGWEAHWREIGALLAEICRSGHNVIVSLHPRVNPDDYRHLEESHPVRIARQPLKDVLPVADVFVAVNSSTVFWAVLCGIPVVVLDYFELDSSLFAHLSTISYVKARKRIGEAVAAAFNPSANDFTEDWRQLARDTVFDGRVTRRYYEIVCK